MTPTGLTCQRWDSQYPHNHTFLPQAYPCKWVRHSHKTAIHSLTHLHALISKHITERPSLCFLGTWEKTTVEIQMAKNSHGALLRTQEYAQCSAATSLSAAPKTSLSVVRDSTALFNTQNRKGRSDFSLNPMQHVQQHLHFQILWAMEFMRPCNHTYWFVSMFTLSLWRSVAL